MTTYSVISRKTVTGGQQIYCYEVGKLYTVPGLSLKMTLSSIDNSVSCYWTIPLQLENPVGGECDMLAFLLREGSIISTGQPFKLSGMTGVAMMSVGCITDDKPGYLEPTYEIGVMVIKGGGRVPANWGNKGLITCDEVAAT